MSEEYKYNTIDKYGNVGSDIWITDFYTDKCYDGIIKVFGTNGLFNFVTKDGKILSQEWFYTVYSDFNNGYAVVDRLTKFGGDRCKIDTQGNLSEYKPYEKTIYDKHI